MKPEGLDCLEISGDAWRDTGFKSYANVSFPSFDICRDRLAISNYDMIIAEQVFEHISDPQWAAENVFQGLRPGGTFVITLPFLVRWHPMPIDNQRWTAPGLKLFLERAGFSHVEAWMWGNRDCLIANLDDWPIYNPGKHSLKNDPAFPVVVWGVARRG